MQPNKNWIEARSAVSVFRDLKPSILAGNFPRVTIYLVGGQTLTGLLCGISEHGQHEMWGTLRFDGQKETDTCFFSTNAVQAVVIENFQKNFEESTRLAQIADLSALEFRRRVGLLEKELSQVSGFALELHTDPTVFESDPATLGRWYFALQQLTPAMKNIAADKLGKESLKGKVGRIDIKKTGDQPLKLEQKTLVIDLGKSERFLSAQWETGISRLL